MGRIIGLQMIAAGIRRIAEATKKKGHAECRPVFVLDVFHMRNLRLGNLTFFFHSQNVLNGV